MGGYGSGSWIRWDSKKTTESQYWLDIRLLKKKGHLDGSIHSGTWSWKCNGEKFGSIEYCVNLGGMLLTYRHRTSIGEWEKVEQQITFGRTPCNYGGTRVWFCCPKCYRRVALLYGSGKYFYCRHCHDLTYACQQESKLYRLMRKARKIRTQLDEDVRLIDSFPAKPKNMHWKTYYKLFQKALRADATVLELLDESYPMR